jgi:leucine-rich repeat protein SHOC2
MLFLLQFIPLFFFIQVQNNQLTSLPDSIRGLRVLEKFILSQNQLTTLPDGLFYCTSLLNLNLSRNHLSKLSNKIGDLSYLQELVSYKTYLMIL